jgi:UDP-N-acetylglucosamine--N-acetylmuramyl-(pentapeptide) pyrophosphoryl-undecaprenol N-acetylglucosamine transferase
MRIVIATGGTGGHIFPALETACVLKDRGHEVFFIGALGLGEGKVKAKGFPVYLITPKGLTNRSLGGLYQFGSFMIEAVIQSKGALQQIQPDKVIGFGGYSSFAAVSAAQFLNIPTMIHEQNVVPGKANRLLTKFVKKVAISFAETKAHIKAKNIVWTGCPCHQSPSKEPKETLYQKFGLDPSKKTILVLGGSQGSQKINEVFFHSISSLIQQGASLQAIHMTGKSEYVVYQQKYQEAALSVKVFEFISPIEEAYSLSDVVVARAGAACVFELGAFAIPSVLIPYPLADGHQKYNAQVLERLGLAKIIEQKDLTSLSLKEAIQGLLSYDFDRNAWRNKTASSFKTAPALELAQAVESL